jgi:hypothetical protein
VIEPAEDDGGDWGVVILFVLWIASSTLAAWVDGR